MPEFKLSVRMGNAAFEDRLEVCRLLLAAIAGVSEGNQSGDLKDSNGNTVGEWSVTSEWPDSGSEEHDHSDLSAPYLGGPEHSLEMHLNGVHNYRLNDLMGLNYDEQRRLHYDTHQKGRQVI